MKVNLRQNSNGSGPSAGGPAFAVVMPVGPQPEELDRLQDVIASLVVYGDGLRWLVLIDDSQEDRHLASYGHSLRGCQVISLMNPRRGSGVAYLGGLFAGVLAGLEWLSDHADADF